MRRKTVKVACVSDTHCPFEDKKAVDWALGVVREFGPDYFVFLGDLIEAGAASRFDNEYSHDFRDEQRSGARILDRMRDAGGDAERIWCWGNHDGHSSDPGRIDKALRSAVHFNNCEWRASYLAWKQIPFDFGPNGVFQLGQVGFWHCHDGAEDTNTIKINNACGGHAHRLWIGGHTHRPHGPTQVMKSKAVPLPLWYANTGTLGPRRPRWAHRQDTSMWGPAVALVELSMGRACQPSANWSCHVERKP